MTEKKWIKENCGTCIHEAYSCRYMENLEYPNSCRYKNYNAKTNGDILFGTGLFECIEEQDDGIFVYAKCKGAPLQVLEISKEWCNSPYQGEQNAER